MPRKGDVRQSGQQRVRLWQHRRDQRGGSCPAACALQLDLSEELIEFSIPGVTNKRVFGLTAETFLRICRAYAKAMTVDGALTPRQMQIAVQATAFWPRAPTSASSP